MDPIEVRQDPSHLVACENDREPFRLARTRDFAEPGQLDLEHLAVEEEQGRERLLMSVRRSSPRGTT